MFSINKFFVVNIIYNHRLNSYYCILVELSKYNLLIGYKFYYCFNDIKIGNSIKIDYNNKVSGSILKLSCVSIGSFLFNIELYANKGGKLVRRTKRFSKLLLHLPNNKCKIILPSKKITILDNDNFATLGKLQNIIENDVKRKASFKKLFFKKLKISTKSKNPIDRK